MDINNHRSLIFYFEQYLRQRPLFLSLIRSKEAYLFDRFLKLEKPILDLGCGDGFFAKVVFDAKTVDVGLDLSESRITEAKKSGVYKKLITYNGKTIPFEKNSLATVVSNCVLEHILDLKTVLSEIHRVLKPKGIFYTTVMTEEWEQNLFGSLILGNWYKKWMRKKQVHLNLLSSQEWDLAFKKAGFTIVRRVGYLSPTACKLIDICHYLSFPSLITYKLFGKWVLFPDSVKYFYPINYLTSILNQKVSPNHSGALFYILMST